MNNNTLNIGLWRPKITGDMVYRIKFEKQKDGLAHVTEAKKIGRDKALVLFGTPTIVEVNKPEKRKKAIGFKMEHEWGNFFYASFKDDDNIEELVQSKNLVVAW